MSEFNPKSDFSSYVAIEGPEPRIAAPVQNALTSPAERLARALQKIRDYRGVQSGGGYDFNFYGEGYFDDFVGEDTSMHFWDVLTCIARLLEMPIAIRDGKWRNLETEFYNPRTGIWSRKSVIVAVQDLKDLIDAHINELGISKARVCEYMATPHPVEQDYAFSRMSFDARMATFKEQGA